MSRQPVSRSGEHDWINTEKSGRRRVGETLSVAPDVRVILIRFFLSDEILTNTESLVN